jgi:type IV pilus assembly protein PilE
MEMAMRNIPARRAKSAGFTLIELMIAVAIVAIIVAVAVGSYDFATVKTRRGAAKACLVNDAQYMERYYTLNFKYEDAVLPDCQDDVSDYYTVGFASGSPTTDAFTIQAIPTSKQKDSSCGTLSIDSTGVKGANNVGSCW